MEQRYISDLSNKGDFVHRDLFFRKLHSIGGSDASADAYVNIDNSKQKVTVVKSTATEGAGQWSVFVRNALTSNVEDTPRIAVTSNVTTIASDVTTINGALTVSNYASFEDDVDVTTGSITVGKHLIVDGPSYLGDEVKITKSGNTSVLSEKGLTFNDAWRIAYDSDANGLAFEENTGTVDTPTWTRRFQFTPTI
jgi:hypothetical protein